MHVVLSVHLWPKLHRAFPALWEGTALTPRICLPVCTHSGHCRRLPLGGAYGARLLYVHSEGCYGKARHGDTLGSPYKGELMNVLLGCNSGRAARAGPPWRACLVRAWRRRVQKRQLKLLAASSCAVRQ